jgi:biotin carboxyl carrier protein
LSEATEPRPADRPRERAGDRSPEARARDHASLDRLADQLLPALVAKLAVTGLGEIEVREGDWKVRLRRPTDGAGGRSSTVPGRRSSDRGVRSQPGHEGHGHAPGALEGHRSARGAVGHSSNGSGPASGRPVGPGHDGDDGGHGGRPADPHRAVATSPAVGVFQPRADLRPGARVRSGDRLGAVDMLGVAQDVVAPADGVVTGILAEAGDAVEYGQDLVAVELMTRVAGGAGAPD